MAIHSVTQGLKVNDANQSVDNYGRVSYGSMNQTEINALVGIFPGSTVYNETVGAEQIRNGVQRRSFALFTDIPFGLPPIGPAGGDLAGTYTNPTIAANAVTNTKSAQMPALTIKGNRTGVTANQQDMTVQETKDLLGVEYTFVDDFHRIFTSGTTVISNAAYITSGTINTILGVPTHPGICQPTTGNPLSSDSMVVAGQATTTGTFCYQDIVSVESVVRMQAVTNGFYVPVGASQNRTIAPLNTIYFRKTNTDTNFVCVAVQGGVSSTVNSGIVATAGQRYKFKIIFGAANITYFIDGVLVGTIAKTILNTQALSPGFYVQNLLAGAPRTIDCDRFLYSLINR